LISACAAPTCTAAKAAANRMATNRIVVMASSPGAFADLLYFSIGIER
jgi:hypothetical protein